MKYSAHILVCFVAFSAQTAHSFRYFESEQADHSQLCPVTESKPNLDIDRFMGQWYILEYQYPKEMPQANLACLSFHFKEDQEGIIGNFSFRFPPRFGHFYHVPTVSSIIANGQEGLWMTQFKGVDLLTAVVDTDYRNWAVFVQCVEEGGENRFMSTRVMSRKTDLSAQDWLSVREVIKGSNLEAKYKYEIDQVDCEGRPQPRG